MRTLKHYSYGTLEKSSAAPEVSYAPPVASLPFATPGQSFARKSVGSSVQTPEESESRKSDGNSVTVVRSFAATLDSSSGKSVPGHYDPAVTFAHVVHSHVSACEAVPSAPVGCSCT